MVKISQKTLDSLALLRKQYAEHLPGKIDALAAEIRQAMQGSWNPGALDGAFRAMHSLSGSAGSYGLPEVSSLARAVEECLRAWREQGQDGFGSIQEQLASSLAALVCWAKENAR